MRSSPRNSRAISFVAEARSQPAVLEKCADSYAAEGYRISRRLRSRDSAEVLFTGMGASLYAALPATYYLNAKGVPAHVIDTAELLHYRLPLISRTTSLVIVSQSGETIEAKRLLARLKNRQKVIAITNHPRSALGRKAEVVLPLHAGKQEFASTKTYTASVFVALLLAAAWHEGRMNSLVDGMRGDLRALRSVVTRAEKEAAHLADAVRGHSHVFLLGRGPSLASALEGALLFKEVCAMPAEGMTAAQFRHGPMELLARPPAIILFAPRDSTFALNRTLYREMVHHGAPPVCISSASETFSARRCFRLPRLYYPALTPIFEIVAVQFLTWELARRCGRDPGRLRIARNVTLRE